jgi:hypothetical protein
MGRGQSGLENPERERTYWLATVRPEGWPHVMPLLSVWLDDAFYFLTSETTREGKNLAADFRCVTTVGRQLLPGARTCRRWGVPQGK